MLTALLRCAAVMAGCAHAMASAVPLRRNLPRGDGSAESGVLCRLKKGGAHFEVLCHAAQIERFREGSIASRDDVLMSPELFKDAKRGERPSAEDISSAFGDADASKAIDEVLLKGDFQLSTAERKKKTEDKRAEIVTFITSNYIEPHTEKPIPRTRIENSMEQMKGFKIDPFRSAATQAEEISKKLKDMFPLVKNEVFE